MSHKPEEDSDWVEVDQINNYALFMGYLSMAIQGVGFLVFLWTTVVLLGGFVSMLGKKDFWSLTIITLVQTAGVFDVFLKEKLRHVGKSVYGLGCAISGMLLKDCSGYLSGRRLVLAYVLLAPNLMLLAVILCPLALFYLFGLLITTGLSLWRLIERDYGMSDDGGSGANLAQALNVLYSLVLLQGVLFCYRLAFRFAGKRIACLIAVGYYGFDKEDHEGQDVVIEYMREMKTGCEKDPSFAKGSNLVKFAVALMKPESSSGDYVSGARILDKILEKEELQGQHALIRKLVGSASSSMVMKKLLRSLRSSSQYNRQIRVLTARIVAHLAGEISLASHPDGLRCISSLLDATTMEQRDDDSAPSGHYKKLMVQGLIILDKLAAEEHNRRIISTEQDLLSKAMAPVSADLLHHIDHGEWSDVVAASLQFMCRLVTAPGKTGAALQSQVLDNKDAVKTMKKILECEKCNDKQLHILAIEILTKLPTNACSSISTETKEKFTKLLVDIFTDKKKDTGQMAGEALAMLSDQCESNATIILRASNTVVEDLTKMILDVRMKSGYRISAAQILEHLYTHYKTDDDYLNKLTETMKVVLPEVLKEILFPSKQGEKQTEKAEKVADDAKFSAPNPDLEKGKGAIASHDNANVNDQKDDINKKNVDRKLHAALLSLSVAIFDNLIVDDKALAKLADTIAPGETAFSFPGKLKEMVEGNSEPTASCLRIMKITSRMIISLIKHNSGSVLTELESLVKSLSDASDNMLELEGFIMFSSSDHSTTKPFTSLVKKAQDLLEEKKRAQILATTPSPLVEIS